MKNVYCAVRTGSLNKAVCASYLNGYRSLTCGALENRMHQTEHGARLDYFT